jgi:uncharacterized membrane protein YadS
VFVLNAVGLVIFPPLGHAFGLDETVFGRWAALAIHDTSSVVGAGRTYGSIALEVATTTKLARALWIVPLTLAIAIGYRGRGDGAEGGGDGGNASDRPRGSLRGVHWPWFILGFVAVAALATWVPAMADIAPTVKLVGTRLLVLALFLIGLSLSRAALAAVGPRPLVLGVSLWLVIASVALVVVRATQ